MVFHVEGGGFLAPAVLIMTGLATAMLMALGSALRAMSLRGKSF